MNAEKKSEKEWKKDIKGETERKKPEREKKRVSDRENERQRERERRDREMQCTVHRGEKEKVMEKRHVVKGRGYNIGIKERERQREGRVTERREREGK